MKIGVVSDTHNHFDPVISDVFRGVDHILHGGDVGMPRILLQLEQIAPVTAVLGNTDSGIELKESELVILAERRILLHHIVEPERPSETIRRRLSRDRPDIVVFGHTHKPFHETIDGVRFLNPGYAGKSRFGMARSVAILSLEGDRMEVEFKPL